MNKLKLFHLIIHVLEVLLLLTILSQVGWNLFWNQNLKSGFVFNKIFNLGYELNLPMEEMNMQDYIRMYLITAVAAIGRISEPETVTLQTDLRYYSEVDGEKILALEIPKGTSILLNSPDDSNYSIAGYGLYSFPTYERGWRYVKPFQSIITNAADLPYYYVRLEDLKKVLMTYVNTSDTIKKAAKKMGFTRKEVYQRLLDAVEVDQIFYNKGVFLSPDLMKKVWNYVDSILLCFILILIIADSLLYRYSNKYIKRYT